MEIEEKYDAKVILRHVWGKYFSQPGHENSEPHEYQIFIEIGKSNNNCYFVTAEKDKPAQLWRGFCTGSSWREIRDPLALSNDKDLLGKIYIRFRFIGNIIKQFSNYEEFWSFIKS